MNTDATQHNLEHILAVAQEQMQDLAVLQQQRATLTAKGASADGTVQVTLDAQRTVISTVIDESYLEEFEFTDLGGHITTAAQQAAQEIERQSAVLLAPLTKRREEMMSFKNLGEDVPDFGKLLSNLLGSPGVDVRPAGENDVGAENDSRFPTVRR